MKMDHTCTLMLADDHPMMRRGLRQLIELEADFRVIAEASNGVEVCELVSTCRPDLILLDNNMPELNGVETLKRLRDMGFLGKVVLFTISDSESDVRDAMRYGADGYLLKDMEPERLVDHLREVMNDQLVVSEGLSKILAQALRPVANESVVLTDREHQVLKMVAGGLSNKMIGSKLGIAEGTVKVHVKSLLHKLGLRSRVEAAVWSLKHPH